jgi:hypothetical protein
MPAASTSSAVPRSGCFMIRPTGTSSSTAATAKSSGRNWPSRFWNHQASISGMAIFRISLGWITTPMFTQRRAPFLVMPNTATAISSADADGVERHRELMSRCGGTCATTNMMVPAISMLRPWSTKRVPWSNPEEYIVSSPAQASRNTAKARKPSKPWKMGAARAHREG